MRIGFLFNHDQIHQVAHSLPIALEIARLRAGCDVSIAVTNQALADEVERLGGPELRSRGVAICRLDVRSWWRRGVAAATAAVAPARKLLVYGNNLAYFETLDALVVAEKTSLLLRRFPTLGKLAIIHTRHGAGDRAIGFDRASAGFDLVLVSGPKVRRRLIDEAGVEPSRVAIVGYPKFDLDASSRMPFAGRENPVALYNPHVSPHLSSWYRMGRDVLDWFAANPRFNLIFAPHVMLFERKVVFTIDRLRVNWPGKIARHVLEAPNIFIDLGSRASTDMTYTRRADVYLGDVSSQVYEFMQRPRACVFLDAHRTSWRGNPNYAHWTAGPVINAVDQLGAAIEEATSARREQFLATQRRLLAQTFDLTDEPSSRRAARAIISFLNRRAPIAAMASNQPAEQPLIA